MSEFSPIDYTWRASTARSGYLFSAIRHHKPVVGDSIIGMGREWKIIDVGELVENTYYDIVVK